MLKYTLRKLIYMIPKILAITVVLFFLLELTPGDPVSRMTPPDLYAEMTEHQRWLAREELGLNDPAPLRYIRWLGGLLQGDFGYSTSKRAPVIDLVADRLPASMELTFYSLILSAIIGVFFGFLCAVYQRTAVDYIVGGVSVVGISLPEFFFALVFMLTFSVWWPILPTGGRVPTDVPVDTINFWNRLPYMILPIGTLTFTMVCGVVRFTRITMLDVMNKDYIKTARAKGISETKVNVKHVLRNAMPPVMTTLVMRLPRLVGGSVVIEQCFNYQGIGLLGMAATQANDAYMCLFTCFVGAMMSLLASTLVDVVIAAMDPRVRFE